MMVASFRWQSKFGDSASFAVAVVGGFRDGVEVHDRSRHILRPDLLNDETIELDGPDRRMNWAGMGPRGLARVPLRHSIRTRDGIAAVAEDFGPSPLFSVRVAVGLA